MNDKLISLLGFAAKAGKLSYGYEAVVSAIKSKKSQLVILACDISEKTSKEIAYYTNKAEVHSIKLNEINIFSLSAAVGRKCGIISVNDNGFATAISAHEQEKNTNVGGIAND